MKIQNSKSKIQKLLLAGIVCVLTTGLAPQASGQSLTNLPPAVPSVIDTFTSFVTTRNTNLFFQDIIVWDGPVYQSQVNVANELGLSVDAWHSQPNPAATNASTLFAAPETRLRQGALAGALISEAGGGEFGWQIYDLRVGLFADGLYRNQLAGGQHDRLGFEGGVFADKLFGKNSGIGLFLSEQTGSAIPLIGLNVNLTFGSSKGFLGIF